MASAPDVSLALSMDLLYKFQLCLDYLIPDQPPCVSFLPPPAVNESPDAFPSLSPACPSTAASPLSIKVEAFSVNDRPRLRIYAIKSDSGGCTEPLLSSASMPTPPASMTPLPPFPTVHDPWSMFQHTESGLNTPSTSGSSAASESEPFSPPMSSGTSTPSDFHTALPADTNPFPMLLSQPLSQSTSPQIPGPSLDTLPSTWHWDDPNMITADCSEFVRAMQATNQWNRWEPTNEPSIFPSLASANTGQFVLPPPLSGPGIDGDFDKLGLPPLDSVPSQRVEDSMDTSPTEPSQNSEPIQPEPPLILPPDSTVASEAKGSPLPSPSLPPPPQPSKSKQPAIQSQASGEHVFAVNPIPAAPQPPPTLPPPPPPVPSTPESNSTNAQPIRTARRRGFSSASHDGSNCSCHVLRGDGSKARTKKQHMHCADCEETFTRRHDLLRHEVRLHGKVCDWVCERCEKFFSSAARLKRHECSIIPRLASGRPSMSISSDVP